MPKPHATPPTVMLSISTCVCSARPCGISACVSSPMVTWSGLRLGSGSGLGLGLGLGSGLGLGFGFGFGLELSHAHRWLGGHGEALPVNL
eukprot:scaffold86391_cov60-Phaeocystis_antarctica.AAC.2